MTGSKTAVGCAGAGTLGSAIVERLLATGFDVSVWNRSHDKLRPLIAAGATAVDTPSALAERADLLITCVTNGSAVEDIVFSAHGVATAGNANKLLVDMSTIDSALTRTLAARARERCAMGWLDAPISGGAPAAREGRMAIMVGGSNDDFDRARPLWDALAARATLMGEQGAGQATKMINQVLVHSGFALLAEACALAERSGVDPTKLPDALAGGRADSSLLQEFMARMARSEFQVEGRIDNGLKDLAMISDLAKSTDTAMPLTSLVEQLYRKMVADGLGDRDNIELVRLYRGAS